MPAISPSELDFSDAWIDGDDGARWRSASALGPSSGARSSGASVLAVDPGCRLPGHTDSAEADVVTTYSRPVQPGSDRAREPVS